VHRRKPARLVLAAGFLLCTLLAAWAVWQPERSNRKTDEAVELQGQGRLNDAFAAAKDAQAIDPLTPRPLLVEASIEWQGGYQRQAIATLQEAVREYPGEAKTWLRLADFQLNRLNRPHDALSTLQGALYLDPRSREVQEAFFAARARAAAAGAATPPASPGQPPGGAQQQQPPQQPKQQQPPPQPAPKGQQQPGGVTAPTPPLPQPKQP
jgi:tetratricopeptide (TPR) repeat protein